MSKPAFVLFAAALWITPALVAGMLEWPGIWGGGSAFSDLIVPAPITGGILHVPSFIVTLLLVRAYGRLSDQSAAFLRAGFLAAALLGVAQLVDLERLYLALATDMQREAIRLHQNYFGLCLLTDASVAWLWVTRTRRQMLGWPITIAVAVVPAAAFVAMNVVTSDRLHEDFLRGRPEFTEQRGDGGLWVYTRLAPDSPGFRDAALEYISSRGPDQNANVQDLAVYFTDSLHVAREFNTDSQPLAVLCLYEDGTATQWHSGPGECFSDHENFSERLDRMYDLLPEETPPNVQTYLVALNVCTDFTVPLEYDENEETNYCRYARLSEK